MPSEIDEGMRLRSRQLSSPFNHPGSHPGTQTKVVSEDERTSEHVDRVIPSFPDMREEQNENFNASNPSNLKELLTNVHTDVNTARQSTTAQNDHSESQHQSSAPKDILRTLSNQEKLTLFENLVGEDPDFATSLMDKIGTTGNKSIQSTQRSGKENPFVSKMPYPPDYDRRINPKSVVYNYMPHDNHVGNHIFQTTMNFIQIRISINITKINLTLQMSKDPIFKRDKMCPDLFHIMRIDNLTKMQVMKCITKGNHHSQGKL